MTWKQVIVKIVELLTEDRIVAMTCLTILGFWTIYKFPVEKSLPIMTGIIGGISGFVTGISKRS